MGRTNSLGWDHSGNRIIGKANSLGWDHMKFLCTDDWHIRFKNPKNRLGSYFKDQVAKIEWILETAADHECEAILLAGDMGNTPVWSEFLKQYYIDLLSHYGILVLTVFGQHDARHHSLASADRTTLRVLEASRVLRILTRHPHKYIGMGKPSVFVYGASWGEKVPELYDQPGIHILVIHRMIIGDKKLWAGQQEYEVGHKFLKKYGYDLIVSGDNHQFFASKYGDRYLVNCGALMRSTASEESIDHKPQVVIYDSKTGDVKFCPVPCRPADQVLTRKGIERARERSEQLEAFITGISEDYAIELKFRTNLRSFIKKNVIGAGPVKVLRQAVEGLDE